MSDAKPYTTEEVERLVARERASSAPSWAIDDETLLATVRALDAAQAENAALKARVAELESALDVERGMARAQMSAILYTVGGEVEGAPTSAINYLQRLRELVKCETSHQEVLVIGKIEAERDEAAAQVERLRAVAYELVRLLPKDQLLPQFAYLNAHRSITYVPSYTQAEIDSFRAALSSPIAPWLAERDRALAMKAAAEGWYAGWAAAPFSSDHQMPDDHRRSDVAAIVDAARKVKP